MHYCTKECFQRYFFFSNFLSWYLLSIRHNTVCNFKPIWVVDTLNPGLERLEIRNLLIPILVVHLPDGPIDNKNVKVKPSQHNIPGQYCNTRERRKKKRRELFNNVS